MLLSDNINEEHAAVTTLSSTLQDILDSAIATALTTKHLHWVVRGHTFQQIHELLDTIVDVVHTHTDTLAERMVYMSLPPEPYEGGTLPIPSGFVAISEAVGSVAQMLDALSELIDDAYELSLDPATEDVLIGMQRDVDKYQWFARSHL